MVEEEVAEWTRERKKVGGKRTCNPSGLLSLPPTAETMYGFPVAGRMQLSFKESK